MSTTPATSRSSSLHAATMAAQAALIAAGAALLVLGVVIWTGNFDDLIPLHVLVGIVLVLSLWTIAAIAARSGVDRWLVGAAVAWSVAAPLLGTTQEALVQGGWHWTIQVLHLVVAMGVVAWGRLLVLLMARGPRS